MQIRKFIIYLVLMVVVKSYGQELHLPVFTQYLADNNFVISPAYAGIGDNVKLRFNGLTQWVGIEDAPDNQAFYGDVRIADRTGVGLTLYNDRNGNTLQSGLKISFAHHIILDYYSKQYLSFGLSYNLNTFKVNTHNFEDGFGVPPQTPFDNRRTSNHNFDVALLYRNKGYFLSFNANNILPKDIDEAIRKLEPKLLLNYQIYTGITLGRKYGRVEYEPSVFYQMFSADSRSSTDVNFKVRAYNRREDYIWGGVSYRFLNDQFLKPLSIGPMAGFQKGMFYFGYAYQVTTNDIGAYNSGTHLVTIGLNFLQGISNCPCTQSPIHY